MLTVFWGRLRTFAQYSDLFRTAGFKFDVRGDVAILEANPVGDGRATAPMYRC